MASSKFYTSSSLKKLLPCRQSFLEIYLPKRMTGHMRAFPEKNAF